MNDNRDAQLITDQLGSNKLIDYMTQIINLSGNFDSFIRPITLELCALLLMKLCIKQDGSCLSDHHLAIIEQTKENSTSVVRNYFRNENEQLFLDLFEDEYMEYSKFKINVEYLMMDANLLIQPKQLVPLMLNNLHFTRRLPYSDIEKARYALRVFFVVRNLSMKIVNKSEQQQQATQEDNVMEKDNENDDSQLPLTSVKKKLITVGDNIDLNNCNLVHCFLQPKNQSKEHREEGYIVILDEQLVFIEPDNQRIDTVKAKYIANLQNIDVYLDKDDSRSLLITIRPNAANGSQSKFGLFDLNAIMKSTTATSSTTATGLSKHSNIKIKLLFDDYIRCRVSEQQISKGKQNVIQRKLRKIANLIDIQLDTISTQSLNSNRQHRNHLNSQNSRSLKHAFAIPGSASAMIANGNNSNKNSSNKLPIAVFKSKPLKNSNKNSRDSSKERSIKSTENQPQTQLKEQIQMNNLKE